MITIKKIYYLNQIGQRPELEDCIYPPPGKALSEDRLFLVCDGVGGESLGEEASRIACEGFSQYFASRPPAGDRLLKKEVEEAQRFVLEQMKAYAATRPEAGKMSTTLTLIYIGASSVSAAWCGDSRIYHLRNGKVYWRSQDHSLVANLVKHGELSPEEAHRHPNRNVITRSLSASGHPSEIELHYLDDIRGNDSILLCTDGLLEQIDETRLTSILLDERGDKAALFMKYAERVTKDNFSMYLLTLDSPNDSKTGTRNFWLLLILLLVAATALLSFFLLQPRNKEGHSRPPRYETGKTQPTAKTQGKDIVNKPATDSAKNTSGTTQELKDTINAHPKRKQRQTPDLNGNQADSLTHIQKSSENVSPLPSASKTSDKHERH